MSRPIRCVSRQIISITQNPIRALKLKWVGGIYRLTQSFVAIALLEIVNYIEHYGLTRRSIVTADGPTQFERAHSLRRYQALRHHPDSPQLPAGYASMILLALVPPLWFRVMNPCVPKHQ